MTNSQNNYEQKEDKIYLENKLIAVITDGIINYASGQIKRFHSSALKKFLQQHEQQKQEEHAPKQEKARENPEVKKQSKPANKSINSDLLEEDPLEPPLPEKDRFFGCYTYEWFISDIYRIGKDGFLAKWNPFKKNNQQQYEEFIRQLKTSKYAKLAETINQ